MILSTPLDKIDRLLLKHLQNDGSLTNVELAKMVGISAPPCLRRVKMLEEQKVIQSYHASLNAPLLGFGVIIFAEISLSGQNDVDLRDFEEQVQKWPLVRDCYMVTGGSDFLLKIVARDFDAYQNFLSSELSTFKKVSQIKTRMVLRTAKSLPGVPVELMGIQIKMRAENAIVF